MSEFTASNGLQVSLDTQGSVGVSWGSPKNVGRTFLDQKGTAALREFFRAEEDERLGRWRSTIDAAWTAVVQADSGYVFFRHDDGERGFSVAPDQSNMPSWTRELQEVAREYFDAHPEPKPWHDANPGEVWVLRISNGPTPDHAPAVVSSSANGNAIFTAATYDAGGTEEIALTATQITYATRIWPEDTE